MGKVIFEFDTILDSESDVNHTEMSVALLRELIRKSNEQPGRRYIWSMDSTTMPDGRQRIHVAVKDPHIIPPELVAGWGVVVILALVLTLGYVLRGNQ